MCCILIGARGRNPPVRFYYFLHKFQKVSFLVTRTGQPDEAT